ncbi:MAG TPA: family 43 glycosylhydrolase [Candidatus Avimonoglobus intestinipullorum]|uniref:Family 43 glycosylhydrolase n=1 Tax=Candidatus Avimonoglobus intestinipullorum TaxID=2840699 RepID=A0A9D1S6E3_9FIRM|nr:family 43 glycosylhydrolase [Candidatus Avimonoglobus intestinipullorum]
MEPILKNIPSPILFQGDATTAYRDPAVIYNGGVFYMFFTLVKTFDTGGVYLYTAESKSRDLVHWSAPVLLTPGDQRKNFSSPGNVVFHDGKWVLCLQTYCRENGEKYGNERCRLYTMESADLEHWSAPALLRVKGDVPEEQMGRMIDPYLVQEPGTGRWFCFYKQNGISYSVSEDLQNWAFCGNIHAGENPCILRRGENYFMFHSPENGIGILESGDLLHWKDTGTILYLGQQDWEWAKGRITAGMVLDCTGVEGIGKYIMFFHGSGPEDEQTMFDNYASIGICWSDDLFHWEWPQ